MFYCNIYNPSSLSSLSQLSQADQVFIRWVLTWLPNPELALGHISTFLRPGGAIAIQDYFGANLFEIHATVPTPMFDKLLDVMLVEWYRNGNPNVDKKIPQHLENNHFRIDQVEPISPRVRAKGPDWIWPTTYFYTQIKRLANEGMFTAQEVETFVREWQQIGELSTTWYSPPKMATFVATKLR